MVEDPEQAELDALKQEERRWQKQLLIAKNKEAVKKGKEAALEVEGRLAAFDEHALQTQASRVEILLTYNTPATIRQRSDTAAAADLPPLKRTKSSENFDEDDSKEKVVDPNPYDYWTPKELFEFIFTNERVLLIRRSKYQHDKKKVLFASSYLRSDTLLSWSRFETRKGIENIS